MKFSLFKLSYYTFTQKKNSGSGKNEGAIRFFPSGQNDTIVLGKLYSAKIELKFI